jgi:NADH-quinone oxidoreductase subunit L
LAHDDSFRRFFLYLNIFLFAMLTLVLADNFSGHVRGLGGVGLCSYLLIGLLVHTRPAAAEAGKKAFIMNRGGRLRVLPRRASSLFVVVRQRELPRVVLRRRRRAFVPDRRRSPAATLLAVPRAPPQERRRSRSTPGCPTAMEGPTPVSALIHAATMVTPAVYMVARCHLLFQLAPLSLEARR